METENCSEPYSLLSLFPCYNNCQRLGSPRADIETELGYKIFIRDQYLLREGGANRIRQRKNLSTMQIQQSLSQPGCALHTPTPVF